MATNKYKKVLRRETNEKEFNNLVKTFTNLLKVHNHDDLYQALSLARVKIEKEKEDKKKDDLVHS